MLHEMGADVIGDTESNAYDQIKRCHSECVRAHIWTTLELILQERHYNVDSLRIPKVKKY